MLSRDLQILAVAGWLGAFAAWPAIAAAAGEPRLVDRSRTRQLLLDNRVVDAVEGLELRLGKVEKDRRNPLIQADMPWENALNNLYPNVLYDQREQRFKLWYKCVLVDPEVQAKMMPPREIHGVGWFLLYATSQDGLGWDKPDLGLHGFGGSKRNNAVARDTPNVGVFKDEHDPDPERRYKMIYDVGRGQMRVRFSPDGVHWSEPLIPEGLGMTGDTHNNAWWDERIGRYVLITRFYLGERTVARSESDDFLHWDAPRLILRSTLQEGAARQAYCMPSFPYANVYLGYLMMYNQGTDRSVDCELAWSPDSIQWQRVCPGAAIIPRGPEGSYDSLCIYGPSGPAIEQDGNLLIYYGGDDSPHQGWKRHCLPCLARLRMDGFAGFEPAEPGGSGVLTTQPMFCTGEPLRITADASGGSIRIAVLGQEGFAADQCMPVTANVTGAPVRWTSGAAFDSLRNKVVRLACQLERAKLYSIAGVQLVPRPIVRTELRHFDDSIEVTLGVPDDAGGAAIRYTLDATEPALDSPQYAGPIRLTETTVVKARLFFPALDGGGPVEQAAFVKRAPWAAAHPGERKQTVEREAAFDRDGEGWHALDELAHRADGGQSGGYVTVSRAMGQPYAVCRADSSAGRFTGCLPEIFGGDGVEVSFHYRADKPAGGAFVEVFAGQVAQWGYHKLPPAGQQWRQARVFLRYDWNDAEAKAAGWQPSIKGFSWQETIRNVGQWVVGPSVATDSPPASFDLDTFRIRTVHD
jgi:hypothetical protein